MNMLIISWSLKASLYHTASYLYKLVNPRSFLSKYVKMNFLLTFAYVRVLIFQMKSVFDPCQDENDLVKIETCSSLVATSEDNSSSCSERSGMDTQPSQPSQEVLAPSSDMMKVRPCHLKLYTECLTISYRIPALYANWLCAKW